MADEEQETEGGKGLRAQLEAALAAVKAAEERAKAAESKARAADVKAVLDAKGVNPKIAKFIGADVDDIEAWLTENADVFGFTVGQGTGEPNVDPDAVGETKRFQNLSQQVAPAGKLEDIQARMASAKSDAEIDELWKEAQAFIL